MCQHQPQCPQWRQPDRFAARIVADRPEQGWSLLCNGVVLFEDDSELVIASVTARRERENCAYVRVLLARKQPEFARALALAEQALARQDVASCSGSLTTSRALGCLLLSGTRLRPGQEFVVPSAVAISLMASASGGLTLCPSSRCAAAALPARVRTKRR